MSTANPAAVELEPPVLDATCGACPHPLGEHDELGLRFCAATVSAALPRGCICR